MIGDAFSGTLTEIERYQTKLPPNYADPEMKKKIASVTTAVRDLLRNIDTPPGACHHRFPGRARFRPVYLLPWASFSRGPKGARS